MIELNSEIYTRLKNVLSSIENYLKSKGMYSDFLNEYYQYLEKLRSINSPLVYIRDVFTKYVLIYGRIIDIERVVASIENVSIDELKSILDDLKNDLDNYIETVKKAYRREKLVYDTPKYIALLVFMISGIVYFAGYNALLSLITTGFALILVTSMYIVKYNVTLSSIINIIIALTGIALIILLTQYELFEHYIVLILIAVVVLSIINIQSYRLANSQIYKDRLREAIDNLRKLSEELKKIGRGDYKVDPSLESEALKLFRELYGEDAEKYLRYKVNVMVMHGYRRDDVLKKLITNLRREKG